MALHSHAHAGDAGATLTLGPPADAGSSAPAEPAAAPTGGAGDAPRPRRSVAERDALIALALEPARHLACSLVTKLYRGRDIGHEEFEAEATAVVVAGAVEYVPESDGLGWMGWIMRRVRWRLVDYARRWHRLARGDFSAGRPSRLVENLATEALTEATPAATPRGRRQAAPEAAAVTADTFQAATAGLRPSLRRLLTLRYLDGLRMGEIALCLGLKPARVRQLHHRAIHSLRDSLTPARLLGLAAWGLPVGNPDRAARPTGTAAERQSAAAGVTFAAPATDLGDASMVPLVAAPPDLGDAGCAD